MNNKLEEIRENINHIRTIPGGYNTANYSLLIEYVDYLLTQLAESQRREKATVAAIGRYMQQTRNGRRKLLGRVGILRKGWGWRCDEHIQTLISPTLGRDKDQ